MAFSDCILGCLLYILTFGLAFLETAANPYILSMGPAATATRQTESSPKHLILSAHSSAWLWRAKLYSGRGLQVGEFRKGEM